MARTLRKPRIPSHFTIRVERADARGAERMHFESALRQLRLSGSGFDRFARLLAPLLDGTRTIEEIAALTRPAFSRRWIESMLALLDENELLEEGDVPIPDRTPEPQHNLVFEVTRAPEEVARRARSARVGVLGLGGGGAAAALSMARMGIGEVHCIDDAKVSSADVYLGNPYRVDDVGCSRADVVVQRIRECAPGVRAYPDRAVFANDEDLASRLTGIDVLLCSLDRGRTSLLLAANRICLERGMRWTACVAEGVEVILGPTVIPGATACHLCYRKRAINASEEPADALGQLEYQQTISHDRTSHDENLSCGAGLAGELLALEGFKLVSGIGQLAARGGLLVFDLVAGVTTRHVVLRKPWCPACAHVAPARVVEFPGDIRAT